MAAGVVVGKVGAAVVYPKEIVAAEREGALMDADAKVLSVASAAEQVTGWRRQGRRVGFTNGCFDLLHPGHISLIRQARRGCDQLVVGLNSDASVKRLKAMIGRSKMKRAARQFSRHLRMWIPSSFLKKIRRSI